MKTEWYLFYFKGRSEKKVSEFLIRKKIETYFPVSKLIKNADTNKVVDQPLFSSYIFVRTTEKQLAEIKKVPSIINMVYWLGKPVIITEYEVITLRRFLSDHVNVKMEKITLGDRIVKKVYNPVFEEENSYKIVNQNIHIVLPSLGYKITAEAETSNVRIISPDNLIKKSKLKTPRLFNPVQIFNNF